LFIIKPVWFGLDIDCAFARRGPSALDGRLLF
jgi:hypothetical protein